jgi:hypothetical protein
MSDFEIAALFFGFLLMLVTAPAAVHSFCEFKQRWNGKKKID